MEATKTSKSFKSKLSKLVFRSLKPASKSEPIASPLSEKVAHDNESSPSVKSKGEKGRKGISHNALKYNIVSNCFSVVQFLKERVPRLVKKFSKQPSPSPQTTPYASPNEVEQCQDVFTEKQTGEHDILSAAFSTTDSDVEKENLKLPAVIVALEERARRNEVVEVSTSVLGTPLLY